MSSVSPTLELAGLTDHRGVLEPAGPWGTLQPVQAEAQDGRLMWRYAEDEYGDDTPVGGGLLTGFLELADAPESRVAAYASKWGVLQLCEHDMPVTHHPLTREGRGCFMRAADGEYTGWEPIDVWRTFARQAFALVRVAINLREGRRGDAADWAIVFERSGKSAPWWKRRGGQPGTEWLIVRSVVDEWLAMGSVRPRLAPIRKRGAGVGGLSRYDGLHLELAGWGLFGALAMQLAMAVSGAAGFYQCDGCGRLFSVPAGSRKPQAGRSRYCEWCREHGVSRAAASRRWRARKSAVGG